MITQTLRRQGIRRQFVSDKQLSEIKTVKKNETAIFLDVGKTLTKLNIHEAYALELGYRDDEARLRKRLEDGSITHEEFDAEIAKILMRKGFSKSDNERVAPKVELRPYAEKLLTSEDADVFLVSMAPSFYVDWLARRYSLNRLRCITTSEFHFNNDGSFNGQITPQNELGKEGFVRAVEPLYGFTAGVGDSAKFDGPFLRLCTIGFLIQNESKDFLYTSDLNKVHEAILNLSRAFGKACAKQKSKKEPTIEDLIDYLGKLRPAEAWTYVGVLSSVLGVAATLGWYANEILR
jgi:HAD superfamily phosphoserine phosphatase-like hydrolase